MATGPCQAGFAETHYYIYSGGKSIEHGIFKVQRLIDSKESKNRSLETKSLTAL
jgi:hypothetical protein